MTLDRLADKPERLRRAAAERKAEPVKLPRDLRGTIADHDVRMAAARRFAAYEIGDGSWAVEIINTYLDPAGTALIADDEP